MVEQERYIDLAYARVSTKGQSLERQEQSILKAVPDIQERYFFKDKYTGKYFESRPAFNELKKKIVEAIEELTEKEKSVITLYYYEEMTLKEISMVLDVSESRVSQLHTKALNKMKLKLGEYLDILTNI